jgi:hypothetical protein
MLIHSVFNKLILIVFLKSVFSKEKKETVSLTFETVSSFSYSDAINLKL